MGVCVRVFVCVILFLSFVLKNTAEIFTVADNRFIPFKIFTPGEFLVHGN